jgi:levanbiose-producing levanase
MIAPVFHHYAPGQWMNDPVGLHRLRDRWVLHDQRASELGNPAVGWGRATSADLLSWFDEGIVIPAGPDEWIYSGCVVAETTPRAFFTLHKPLGGLQAQGAAAWHNEWSRVPGECVSARADTRDPFVFRSREEWRMLLAQPPSWDSPFDRPSRLLLLRSNDLEAWEELGPLGPQGEPGEMFETPWLRRVPVAGELPQEWPWLLAVGVIDRGRGAVCTTRAWFGRFDGESFVAAGAAFALDQGPDFYAPAVWAGTPEDEVILTAWTNSWAYARRLPSSGWSGGAHALPRRLTAERDGNGWRLLQLPAALPGVRPSRVLNAGSHLVGERFLLTLEGTGTVHLGDLTVTLTDDALRLERTTNCEGLTDTGFAGRWGANPVGSATWVVDGCVTELVAGDGSAWMSALSLRSAPHPLEWTGSLAATLHPVD